jgi:hypothetical protein
MTSISEKHPALVPASDRFGSTESGGDNHRDVVQTLSCYEPQGRYEIQIQRYRLTEARQPTLQSEKDPLNLPVARPGEPDPCLPIRWVQLRLLLEIPCRGRRRRPLV